MTTTVELVPDHDLWLIAVFYAQLSSEFEVWWNQLSSTRKIELLIQVGCPSSFATDIAGVVIACLKHYGSSAAFALCAPPTRTGEIKISSPPELSDCQGFASLIAALIELYMENTGKVVAQVLIPAEANRKVASRTATMEAQVDTLRRQCGVSAADITAATAFDRGQRRGGGSSGSASSPGDYSKDLQKRTARSPSWMDPGPSKHVEDCRSPSFSLVVGCHRVAIVALAVISKLVPEGSTVETKNSARVWPKGVKAPGTKELVVMAKAFGILGDCFATMDNNVLPNVRNMEQVVIGYELVENSRTIDRNEAVANAASPLQTGIAAGYLFLEMIPQMAIEPFINVLKKVETIQPNPGYSAQEVKESRYTSLTSAACHVGLSSCYIYSGDLRRCEKALTSAIEHSAPLSNPWEPHECADWHVRRGLLRAKRSLGATTTGSGGTPLSSSSSSEISSRRASFVDLEKAVAGLTPDDEEFAVVCFTLALELSKPDGLCGTCARGEKYLALGEAALKRGAWLFGSDFKFFGKEKESTCLAFADARKAYAAIGFVVRGGGGGGGGLGKHQQQQQTSNTRRRRQQLLEMQQSGRVVHISSSPAGSNPCPVARLVCSMCGRRDSDAVAAGLRILRCSVCHQAAYCNATCQKKHWPEHKKVCKQLAKTRSVLQDAQKK